MRDPDLVLRAQQAAAVLERAWDHWRTLHGLGAGTLPPVSSYVGYSLEEPWGQPRVVFGIAAEEAEQLAALLDRSGYGGGGSGGGGGGAGGLPGDLFPDGAAMDETPLAAAAPPAPSSSTAESALPASPGAVPPSASAESAQPEAEGGPVELPQSRGGRASVRSAQFGSAVSRPGSFNPLNRLRRHDSSRSQGGRS